MLTSSKRTRDAMDGSSVDPKNPNPNASERAREREKKKNSEDQQRGARKEGGKGKGKAKEVRTEIGGNDTCRVTDLQPKVKKEN